MSNESYRDPQLAAQIKDLRAAVKSMPTAKHALEKVEARLKYVLKVVELWDASHAERAATLIRLGQIEAANSAASLIFESGLRSDLLRQAPITQDVGAGDRLAESLEMGREVLS
jgi:hypothetical protein